MPNANTRIGVPSILISVDDSTVVPAISGLTFTASGVTPSVPLLNDVNTALSASDTYQVALGLVGRDTTNGGYTVGICTSSSGNLTITSGQHIKVKATNAALSSFSGYDKAVCMAVFLKINNADFQLAQFAYIDPAEDFITVIKTKPLKVAPKFTLSKLTDWTVDDILGNRNPLGITYDEISPTTGTFTFRRPVSNVTVSPNTGADYQIATTRSSSVRFQSLTNDIKAFVTAAAGNYSKITDGLDTIEEAHMSLNTAQALLRGNRPIQVVMPIDSSGTQEVRLLVGNLTVNQIELEEAWSKTAPTPISFQFDAASLDRLITNQHTEIQFKRIKG